VRCLDSIWIAPALQYQPSHWNAIWFCMTL
jgi:hypothetical protein